MSTLKIQKELKPKILIHTPKPSMLPNSYSRSWNNRSSSILCSFSHVFWKSTTNFIWEDLKFWSLYFSHHLVHFSPIYFSHVERDQSITCNIDCIELLGSTIDCMVIVYIIIFNCTTSLLLLAVKWPKHSTSFLISLKNFLLSLLIYQSGCCFINQLSSLD